MSKVWGPIGVSFRIRRTAVDALSHMMADNMHYLELDTWEKNWAEPGRSESLRHVRCHLEDRELWREFHQLGTEMIITKSGRRMFPAVKARFEGCDPDAVYYVLMDVVPVDNHRYRYVYNKSSWQQAGKAEPNPPSRLYKNPDCPYTGKQLTTQTVTFEKAKLTNNDVGDGKVGHLILNSMHKYVPRIHLVRRDKSQADKHGTAPHDLPGEEYWTFTFKEMEFMAVTAYQNQLVTQLKIEKNPFAKGFQNPHGRGDRMSDQPGRTPDVMQSPLHAQGVHMWQQQQLAAERLRNQLLANLGGLPYPYHTPFDMPLSNAPFPAFLASPKTPTEGFPVDPAALQQLFMSQLNPMPFAASSAMQSGAFPSNSIGGQPPPSGRLSGRDDDEAGNSSSAFTSVGSASSASSLIANPRPPSLCMAIECDAATNNMQQEDVFDLLAIKQLEDDFSMLGFGQQEDDFDMLTLKQQQDDVAMLGFEQQEDVFAF